MTVADTEELVLAALADRRDEHHQSPGRSLSELTGGLGSSSGTLSGQIELATTLQNLRTEGLITSSEGDGRDTVFVLTEAGETRAEHVRERLADATIEVVDEDGRRESALAEAVADLGRPLPEIAADCTDDGVYVLTDEPPLERVVGRDAERERCRSVLEDAREVGSGRALFLTGPGGVGKTTLAEAILDEARESGDDVVRARCRATGEPYGPLRDLLAGLDAPASPFTDVGGLPDEFDDHGDFQAQQTGLFYDVTEALAPADDRPPRVLFLDDLHLADPATMAYLEYLLEHLAERPLALVGSYRPTELPDETPISAETTAGDDRVSHVRLDPLDRTATSGVIERVLERRGVPRAFVDAVHERTGGNPLFVEETVTTLLETDQLDPRFEWYPDEPDAIDVPDAVTETIDRRVAALDEAARELLRWAALVGEHVPVDVLEAVRPLSEVRLRTLLEALVEADVFSWTDGRRGIAFRSDVVREALLADLSAAERERRHDAIARALQDADDSARPDSGDSARPNADHDATGDRAAAIAAHHEQAGNVDAAVEWYRQAGERATDVYAHDAAVEHYHGALAMARDGDDRETLLAVAERLAEIYLTTGELDQAERHLGFVRERSDDVERNQRIAILASRVANGRGDYETAIEHAADGLALDDGPSEERCRLYNQQSRAERERSEFDRAIETARRQREEAVAIDDPSLEARAAFRLGITRQAQGEYERAREHMEDALETFRELAERQNLAQIRTALGVNARSRGELEAAREFFRDALEGYRTVGARQPVATVRVNLGIVAADIGEYGTARESYRRALAEFEAIGDRHTAAICRHNIGEVAIAEGEYDGAREYLRDAFERATEIGDRRLAARSRMYAGEASIATGEFETARDALADALEDVREVGDRRGIATARLFLGKAAFERGDRETAREQYRQALEETETIGNRRLAARCRLYLGELAVARGEHETARSSLSEALETFESMGTRRFVAEACTLLGELALAEDDHESATRQLDRALEIAEELGATAGAASARRALGRVAAATGDPGTARDRWRTALATFEEIGATPGTLETLEHLVATCRDRGDEERAREWCQRAATLVADADAELADCHRGWVERHRTELGLED